MRGGRDEDPAATPLWARAEADEGTFAPRPIGTSRRGAWLPVVIAAGSLALVVGLASLDGGRHPDGGATDVSQPGAALAASPSPTLLVAARPPAIGSVQGALGRTPVVLRLPGSGTRPITSASVIVDGELAVHATTLRIALEVDRLHHLGTVTLDATDANGALRPDYPLLFHAELALPSPRPLGRLWLVITAYNRAGTAIGTLRKEIVVGPGLVPV